MAESVICKTCGIEKPESEFYLIGGNGHGSLRRKLTCKQCDKIRIAKRRARKRGKEYETRDEYYGRRAMQKQYRLANRLSHNDMAAKEMAAWEASGFCLTWLKKCKAASKGIHRITDEWKKRIYNAKTSMAMRLKPVPKVSGVPSKMQWSTAIQMAVRNLRNNKNAWKTKIQNTRSNLGKRRRRKSERY